MFQPLNSRVAREINRKHLSHRDMNRRQAINFYHGSRTFRRSIQLVSIWSSNNFGLSLRLWFFFQISRNFEWVRNKLYCGLVTHARCSACKIDEQINFLRLISGNPKVHKNYHQYPKTINNQTSLWTCMFVPNNFSISRYFPLFLFVQDLDNVGLYMLMFSSFLFWYLCWRGSWKSAMIK